MFREKLKQYVESSNLVSRRECGDGIYVLKYKKKVFYDNLWNEYIAECRGSIVDRDFNLVAYPFTKIYNYGIEKSAPVLADDVHVTAYRKVNGFMVACTWYRDDVLISTTGSTDSPYVVMAREMIGNNMDRYRATCKQYEGNTFMFECVHPSDPHIVPDLTAKWVARNPRTDKLLTQQFREQIDEEYYPLLDHIRNNIDTYTVMDEQARLAWVRNYLEAGCQNVIK